MAISLEEIRALVPLGLVGVGVKQTIMWDARAEEAPDGFTVRKRKLSRFSSGLNNVVFITELANKVT